MKNLISVPFLLTLLLFSSCQADPRGVIILVRHAEKVDDSEDPPLSEAGKARAQALAELLKDAGTTAIFSSPYLRNTKTAEPLAQLLKIESVIMPAHDYEPLMQRIRTEHRDDTVLIVGHSDTVPELLKRYGLPQDITIDHDEYDNLFVLVTQSVGPPVLLRLRF